MTSQRLVLVFALLLGACHDNDNPVTVDAGRDMPSNIQHAPPDLTSPGEGQACTTDYDCPQPTGGSSTAGQYLLCNYAIADGCSATGHCRLVRMPTCASITYACGCNGQPVDNSGCFYEPGFAGGPILPGSTYPQDCPGDGGS